MIRVAVLILAFFDHLVFCSDCGQTLSSNGTTIIENSSCDTQANIDDGFYGRITFSGDIGAGSIRAQNVEWSLSISPPSIIYSAHTVTISVKNVKNVTISLETYTLPDIAAESHPILYGQATVINTKQMKGKKMTFTLNNAEVRLNGAADPANKLALTGSFVFGNDLAVPSSSLYSASTGNALSRSGSLTILTVSQETYTDSIAMLLAATDVNEYSTVSLVHSYDYTDPTQKYFRINKINGASNPAALIVYSPRNGPVSVNRIAMTQAHDYVETYAGGLPIADKTFYQLEKYMGTPQQLQMSLPQCFFGQFNTFVANNPALIYADNDESMSFKLCSRILNNGDCGFVTSRNFGFAGSQNLDIGFTIDTAGSASVNFLARSMVEDTSITVAGFDHGTIRTDVIDWRNASDIFDSMMATSFTVQFTASTFSRGGVLNFCAATQFYSNVTVASTSPATRSPKTENPISKSTTSGPASKPATKVTFSKPTLPTQASSNRTTSTPRPTTKSACAHGALLACIGFLLVRLA